jgi:hypothetical protein
MSGRGGFLGRIKGFWSDMTYAMNVQNKTYHRLVAKRKVAEANLALVRCKLASASSYPDAYCLIAQRKKEAEETIRQAKEMRILALQKVDELKRLKERLETKVSRSF